MISFGAAVGACGAGRKWEMVTGLHWRGFGGLVYCLGFRVWLVAPWKGMIVAA